jgi:CxxC motif-containing protein (DUF1111 family)
MCRLDLFLIATVFLLSQNGFASDSDIVKPTTDFSKAEAFEALPGGALTHKKGVNAEAFSHPSQNMSFERQMDFQIGNAFFTRLWVSAPASTKSSDGLGPLFNARACQRCHIKDGRGHPPESNDQNSVSMLVRLSVPALTEEDRALLNRGEVNSIDDPVYGGQLQDVSIAGIHSEGTVTISYQEEMVILKGGQKESLRKPKLMIENLMYGDFHKNIMMSARVAPQMIGLGLLEAIAEQDILAIQDVEDKDRDGISGKANWVWSPESKKIALGRFGLKAGKASLNDQNQAAFNGDIGLSTPLFPVASGDCTSQQIDCLKMPNGNTYGLEVSQTVLEKVLHYTRNLSVPARRDVGEKEVLAGKKLFYQSGCIGCHTPKFITPQKTFAPEQSRQLVWPYTDMLLHDMGDGLADNRPEAKADGREWRTAPLWGIGLTPIVNGHSYYLHDGRARSLLEAVLWHGGEAETAKNKVINMNDIERDQLIKFIQSL